MALLNTTNNILCRIDILETKISLSIHVEKKHTLKA